MVAAHRPHAEDGPRVHRRCSVRLRRRLLEHFQATATKRLPTKELATHPTEEHAVGDGAGRDPDLTSAQPQRGCCQGSCFHLEIDLQPLALIFRKGATACEALATVSSRPSRSELPQLPPAASEGHLRCFRAQSSPSSDLNLAVPKAKALPCSLHKSTD